MRSDDGCPTSLCIDDKRALAGATAWAQSSGVGVGLLARVLGWLLLLPKCCEPRAPRAEGALLDAAAMPSWDSADEAKARILIWRIASAVSCPRCWPAHSMDLAWLGGPPRGPRPRPVPQLRGRGLRRSFRRRGTQLVVLRPSVSIFGLVACSL